MAVVVSNQTKRVFHPCLCRLRDNAEFSTSTPRALLGAGFASFIVGIFTCFRLTPFFLLSLVFRIQITSRRLDVYKIVVLAGMFTWLTLLGFIFFIFGFILLISVKLKRRWLALIHPWGLLLLYFDLFFWLSLTVFLHYEIIRLEAHSELTFKGFGPPLVFFLLIYIDTFFYAVIYWTYATYFIVAELTVIEKHF